MKFIKNLYLPKHTLKSGKIVFFAGLVALLLCTCSSLPKTGTDVFGDLGLPSDPVPFIENVRSGTLPSGLQYFILENSKPKNRAYLTLVVKAGFVHEEENKEGLAHFVEHMAFNGTERFPGAELANYLRSLGMRFGPEFNAFTSINETRYQIQVPVETGTDGTRRIPDKALAVIDDWSRAITFSPEAVDNERRVILEEYRTTQLSAVQRIVREMETLLFRGSPYADLRIEPPEVIKEASASQLKDFYQRWYRADNMALIFTGDFDGAALEASLADHFLIDKPAATLQRPLFDLPPPKKGNIETFVLTDSELPVASVLLYFKRSREPLRGDLAYFRSEIIDALIDRMVMLRFSNKFVSTHRYGYSSRFYRLIMSANTGVTKEALTYLLEIKETMTRFGFSDAELALAAKFYISDLQRQVQEKDQKESGDYEKALRQYYLKGGYLAGSEWELAAAQQLLPHIKTRDINAAIKDYFGSGDLQVFVLAPDAERESLPSDAHIKKMVADSRKMKIEKPKSDAVEERLLSSIPPQGEVISESIEDESGTLVWELSNGARVILKQTQNKNNEIVMQAMARGGTSSARDEYAVSASLAVEMMQVSRLGPWTRSQISRMLAAQQVSFSLRINPYDRGFSGTATGDNLKTLLEMLYLNFTNPRIHPGPAKDMMNQKKTAIANRNNDPRMVFSDEITSTIYSGHPRFKPLELADLPKADINTALAFLRRALNPADYTFIFTGNLEIDIMREYVETYLASIPRGENWNEWTDPGFSRPGKIEKNVYKGKEEQSRVYLAWFTGIPYTEENNAATRVLKEYLQILLIDEIREKLGGVYGIHAGVEASPVPRDELSMVVEFVCDPKRAGELSAEVIRLLNDISGGNINRDIFDKAVEALKKQHETSIQSNSNIARSYAFSSVIFNLPLSRLDRQPQYYSAVTQADIQRICAQLMQGSNGPVQVVLFPER